MKPEYVKCTWTFSDSDYEQNKIYKVCQDTNAVYPTEDCSKDNVNLYACWNNISRTQFEQSTLSEYLLQNSNSKVLNSENLDYLIPFLKSNNIT